jgi:hypothetical protein
MVHIDGTALLNRRISALCSIRPKAVVGDKDVVTKVASDEEIRDERNLHQPGK